MGKSEHLGQQGHVPEVQQEVKGKTAAVAAVGSGASTEQAQAGSAGHQRTLKGAQVPHEAPLASVGDTAATGMPPLPSSSQGTSNGKLCF